MRELKVESEKSEKSYENRECAPLAGPANAGEKSYEKHSAGLVSPANAGRESSVQNRSSPQMRELKARKVES